MKDNNSKSSKIKYVITIIILIIISAILELNNVSKDDNYNSTEVDNTTISTTIDITTTQTELVESSQVVTTSIEDTYIYYTFRNDNLLNSHYKKHGIDMGFASAKDYEKSANDVINNPNSLHKLEAEDNDDIYYLEDTQEFVVLSTDGYIRTYYYANLDYFNRQ